MLCSGALTRSVTIAIRRQTASRTQQLCSAPARNLLNRRLILPLSSRVVFCVSLICPTLRSIALSRYEATLWRQAGRILYARFDALGRRKPQERRRPSRADDWRELPISEGDEAIYLFDVCLLATLFDRAACALRFDQVRRGVHPKI